MTVHNCQEWADEGMCCAVCNPAARATAWRPIETAPKDGTRVLIYEPGFHPNTDGITTAVWDDGNYYVTRTLIAPEPTHWMPLPEVPR